MKSKDMIKDNSQAEKTSLQDCISLSEMHLDEGRTPVPPKRFQVPAMEF
jgi:hypothetical protein